jgi:outer membrane protein assembly factor BamB
MTDHGARPRPAWRYFTWLPAAVGLVAIVLLRLFADNLDFGMVNVVTYLLLFAAWISSCIALLITQGPRLAAILLLVPILLGAVFFAFFRFERFDSEIIPKFASRWEASSKLPDPTASTSSDHAAVEDSNGDQDLLFSPRSTDFPEFLGPNRNATLDGMVLETDWEKSAPTVTWKQPIGQGWSGFAVQGDAAYTIEQRDQVEWVTCYNANTGKLIWFFEIPAVHTNPLGGTGPRSTPTIQDGKVYALSAVSKLVCLDMKDGRQLWSADLLDLAGASQEGFEREVSWGRSASPLVVEGKVVVPLGGESGKPMASLIAFDATTGTELWRGGKDQVSYATPVLANLQEQPQILYISQSHLSSHAMDDGHVLWSVDWPSHSNGDASVSQPIVVDQSRVLMSKGYGLGAQLIETTLNDNQWSVNVLWKDSSLLRTKFTSCVLHAGHAFGLSDGILECVDINTGKRAWKKGRYRHGQILLVGDTLLVTSEAGEVVLVAADPAQHRELAKLQVIGDVTWNTPALSGNRLFMRNSNEAACVLLPLRTPPSDSTLESTADLNSATEPHAKGANE